MHYTLFTILTGLLLAMVFAGGSRNPGLTVVNHSVVALTDLMVFGNGFTQNIGTLAPGAQLQIGVDPAGESSLRFTFAANGKNFASAPECYLENSPLQHITATVGADYNVQVEAD